MKKVYKAMSLLAVLLFIGTAGACDNDTVTFLEAAIMTGAAMILLLVGGFGIRLEDRRGR